MAEISVLPQQGGATQEIHAASLSRAPDRIVHMHVQCIDPSDPDLLELECHEIAGVYAVTVSGHLRGKRVANGALDGFFTKWSAKILDKFTFTVVDPETGRVIVRDRRSPWDSLAWSCQDITQVKRFHNCSPVMAMDDPDEIAGGLGKYTFMSKFTRYSRLLHLRAAIPGVEKLEYMAEEDRLVPGLYAIEVPADLPEAQLANCALDAFYYNVPFESLDRFEITVTDPETGTELWRDENLEWYALAERCLGMYTLERFEFPSFYFGRDAVV